MTKTKIESTNVSRLELSDRSSRLSIENNPLGAVDLSTVAAVLSADYPLIDSSLVHAFLSDYDLSTLQGHLPEIRDQLAILEATLVPDPDDPSNGPSTSSSSPSSLADEIDIDGLKLTEDNSSSEISSVSTNKIGPIGMRSGTSASGTGSTSVSIGDEEEFVNENELLKALFPSLSPLAITEALDSSISLPAAIDHLLSVELIRFVEREGIWPNENEGSDNEIRQTISTSTHELPGGSKPPSRMPSQRSTKRRNNQRTIPLVDTLQRQITPSSSRPSSRSTSRDPHRELPPGPSSNTWHTMTSLADHLSSLLPPTPAIHFLTFCHSPKYHSAYSAIRSSLAALPSTSNKSSDPEDEERSNSILEEIYGVSLLDGSSGKFQEDLEICVDITGGDVATVMDLMDLLDEISHWPGDDELDAPVESRRQIRAAQPPLQPPIKSTPMAPPAINANRMKSRPTVQSTTATERVVPGSRPPPVNSQPITSNPLTSTETAATINRTSKAHKHPGGVEHVQNWREISHVRRPRSTAQHPYASHIPSYARGTLPHDPTPGSLNFKPANPGPSFDDCLHRAWTERQKREEAVRNAGKHFRGTIKGKKHGNLIAGHYASQAREAQEKARLWELKAARLAVQHQLGSGGNTIDLHHLTVLEAETLSLEVAREWFGAGGGGGGGLGKPLIVVTGVGRHSAGGKGVLGPAVGNALEGDGWKVDRGDGGRGYLVVRGKR